MNTSKSLAEIITSMDSQKYNAKILNRYAESMNRRNKLIDQGLLQKRGYELKTPEQGFRTTDLLIINSRKTIIL